MPPRAQPAARDVGPVPARRQLQIAPPLAERLAREREALEQQRQRNVRIRE
jgi:hypothetical protein